MRILTAGESHGASNLVIIEGFPKGVNIEQRIIDAELKKRMSGAGRGKRMSMESDKASILSGLRNKITLGSPISIVVKNKDFKILSQGKDNLPVLDVPRPAHADLSGALKYQDKDVRNILERASARETVSRVCAGSLCKQFLDNFGIKFASFVVSAGSIKSEKKPVSVQDIVNKVKNSKLNCIDSDAERLMIKEIEDAKKQGDSLGGVIEVWAQGIVPGLGSFTHFDRRLDAKLAFYLMSIPAIKGVEVGSGFEYARKRGSLSHDAIGYSSVNGFTRKTNNSGGIEGGMSTGSVIVLRIAMKPIATLSKPLDSVNISTKRKTKAPLVRSDTCAVTACCVIAESMAAIAITENFLEKFGCDSLLEIKTNYRNYCKTLKR